MILVIVDVSNHVSDAWAMNANLNVASSKMSAMLCCSGEKDSAVRDLKSAQNTPSRQPMQPPYTMGTGQFMAPNQQPNPAGPQNFMGPGAPPFRQPQPMYGPPPLNQTTGPRIMGPPGSGPNSYGGPPGQVMVGGPKDDYRKVVLKFWRQPFVLTLLRLLRIFFFGANSPLF